MDREPRAIRRPKLRLQISPDPIVESRSLFVPDGLAGERTDSAIAKLLGFSRTFAAEVAAAGGVVLDGAVLGKSDRLHAGGWLEVSWESRVEPSIVPIVVSDLAIVHDDDDIVIVDKPPGVAAHPSVGWEGPTVLGALAGAGFRIATSGAAERAGIVHRLDVGTSGLMVVAKTEHAYSALKRAFHDREVKKIYHAVVQGHPDPLAGTIDAPIGRHPGASWKFAITSDGKPSVTHYETLEAFPSASLLEIELETGRTHQIRVHMSAQRHPCVGDAMYGADPTISARLGLARQWLHAKRLGFEHPATRQFVEFESPYPHDLQHALEVLRGD
jgi:23S rRNA pseudouridine1911/1915/1917 synthase